MRILKITDGEIPELDEYFDEVDTASIDQIAPKVREGEPGVDIRGVDVEEVDVVFADIPRENAVFGRILLEILEEKGIPVNYYSTAFFTMCKKNYLCNVLQQKNVSMPKTAVVASQKSARNLENYLRGPLIARKFEDFSEVESTKIDAVDEITDFTSGLEYGDSFILFQEYSSGDKYRCLAAGENVIALQDDSEGWQILDEDLKYTNVSSNVEELVENVKNALGMNVAEILVRDGRVVDVNPNPDLGMYRKVSGKNPYKFVAEALKEEFQV